MSHHTVLNEALWCCRDVDKSYSPDVREPASLLQISTKIMSFLYYYIFFSVEIELVLFAPKWRLVAYCITRYRFMSK